MFTSKGKTKVEETNSKADGNLWRWQSPVEKKKSERKRRKLKRMYSRIFRTEWRMVWGPHKKTLSKPVHLPFSALQTVLSLELPTRALHSSLESKYMVKQQFSYGN